MDSPDSGISPPGQNTNAPPLLSVRCRDDALLDALAAGQQVQPERCGFKARPVGDQHPILLQSALENDHLSARSNGD
jgi:hypothetical protein